MSDQNSEMAERMFEQLVDLWVKPEIDRRVAEGRIVTPLGLYRIQVLMPINGENIVRFNDEVHFEVEAKVKPGTKLKPGDIFDFTEVEDVKFHKLLPEDEDYGHITAWAINGTWSIYFSFIYQRTKSRDLLRLGMDYIKSAESDIRRGLLAPAINTLCIASENIAKARLVLQPFEEVHRPIKTHSTLKSIINRHTKVGEAIRPEYAQCHNYLLSLREDARYNPAVILDAEELKRAIVEMKKLANEAEGMAG
jgi:uncharacterized protein (UPF0332 family)